jgi:hypothetical protein
MERVQDRGLHRRHLSVLAASRALWSNGLSGDSYGRAPLSALGWAARLVSGRVGMSTGHTYFAKAQIATLSACDEGVLG